MQDLNRLQRDCKMVIRRSDKAGGWVLVDYNVYKEAGDSKIKETFVDSMGQTRPKYKVVTEATLKR